MGFTSGQLRQVRRHVRSHVAAWTAVLLHPEDAEDQTTPDVVIDPREPPPAEVPNVSRYSRRYREMPMVG